MSGTYSTDGPTCPHCGNVETPDEGFYYDEDTTELDCGECSRRYAVSVFNSTSWTTRAEEPPHGR